MSLFSHDVLPGDHYDQVESISTWTDKAVYLATESCDQLNQLRTISSINNER